MKDEDIIKIIAVDDEPGAVILMKEYLKKLHNFNIRTSMTGFEALEMISNAPADILITDICMPGMNGIELAKRAIQNCPDIAIIGITAYDDMTNAIDFMKIGCLDIIQKPLNLNILDNAIKQAIKRLQLKKALERANKDLIDTNIELNNEIKQRRIAQNSLEKSRNNVESIFNTMNDFVFILDTNGCVLYVNKSLCSHLGYNENEVIGMNILEFHAPQKLDNVSKFVTDMLSGKATLFNGHLMKKNGDKIEVETKVTKGYWNEKDALIAVARDISEFKEAERNMRIAQAESQAKSEFLANISHDLRTPLNGILGYTQILVRDDSLHKKHLEQIKVVHKCGEHLLLLINDILDLSKIEAGKMELDLADFYFDDFLNRIVDICTVLANKKHISLKFNASQDCPKCVKGDEKRLRQVLLNIINNAIKFTFKGQVSFDVSTVDNKIRFCIQDSGIGIPHKNLEIIFMPFQQLEKQENQTEGTGLGLAISRRIVQLMDSDIFVESKEGQGSKFWFEIKLPEVLDKRKNEKKHKWSYVKGDNLRVLVVDDNLLNRKFFKHMLEMNGFEIYEASNGYEAVEQTELARPKLILMDLMMPGMNGIEAINEIRKNPENSDIIIFAISATNMKDKCKVCDCNEFFNKPVNMDDFYSKVQKHLKISAQEFIEKDNSTNHLPQKLIPPAPEELEKLHKMAKTGNIMRIEKMAEEIEKKCEDWIPFAEKIKEFAQGFKINELKDFLGKFV